MDRIYFDYNATTPADPEVIEAMSPYFHDYFGNASSIHAFGQKTRLAIEESREKAAQLLSTKNDTIVFTSGGTESDNFAIKGVVFNYLHKNKGKTPHIITSAIEHPAVLNTCNYLEKSFGIEVTYLPVDKYGVVNTVELQSAIKNNTILVSIMYANNETGTIEPISEIGKIIASLNSQRIKHNLPRIYFHTDAVQAIGKLPVNVDELGVDLLSLSAHKFHGPKGVGVLYIRPQTEIESFIHGGHHERNRRAGTENVPGIVGLGKAVEIISRDMAEENKKIKYLRDKLESGILKNVPNVYLNGHSAQRLSNTCNFSFEFIESESLLLSLDLEGVGIAASSGSACSSGSSEPSHVLTAIGLRPDLCQGSLRFSLGKYNTEQEIDHVLQVLPKEVERLRKMSPLWKK